MARAADPDPFRDRLRAALLEPDGTRAGEAALRALADKPKVAEMTPASAVLVARILAQLKAVEPIVTLLRAVVERYPGDWELNYSLADALMERDPPDRQEALRYYSVARAMRPEASYKLAELLRAMGRGDEVRSLFADLAARLRPERSRGTAIARGGLDLRLMPSLGDASDIPTAGKASLIVADVRGVLHFRIFDGDGRIVVDTDEPRLAAHAGPIAEVRKRLENLWPPRQPTDDEKDQVITAVNSIVGYTRYTRREPPYSRGCRLLDEGKFGEAIAEFREAIRLSPAGESYKHRGGLGMALEGQRDFKGALAEYRAVIREAPDCAEAYLRSGLVLRKQGDYAAALPLLRKSHELSMSTAGYRVIRFGYQPASIASLVAETERMATLAGRMPAVLKGDRSASRRSRKLAPRSDVL